MSKEKREICAASFSSDLLVVYARDEKGNEYAVKFNEDNPLFLLGVAQMLSKRGIAKMSRIYFAVQEAKCS